MLLSACGGGGGGSVPSGPVIPTPVPTASPTPGPGTATFTLTPDATSSITGARRRPRYVSKSTASIAIVLNGAGSATFLNLSDPSQCDATKKCSVAVSAPVGNDTFLVSAYSGPNGTGSLLSRATVQATIGANGASTVPVVLNGDVASISLSLANVNPLVHQVTTDALTVIAKDAKGNTIVGPGGYLYPITLANSDTSGHSSLTTTTLNGPGDSVALQYDGGYGSGSITASAVGAPTSSPAPFVPQITATETTLPGGRTATGLVLGPDGALWFIDGPFMIGRMSAAGQLSEFALPLNWSAGAICAGPDGAMWMMARGQFAVAAFIRRAPDGTYSVYQLPGPAPFSVGRCAGGPDGNVYGNFGFNIVQVTPSGVLTTLTLQDANGQLHASSPIAGSPDGAFWFTDSGYYSLDRYDLATHAITVHPVLVPFAGTGPPFPTLPVSVVVGVDKRFYFNAGGSVYASDVSGSMSAVYTQTNGVGAISVGFAADGAVWFGGGSTFAGLPIFGRTPIGGQTVVVLGTAIQGGFPGIDSVATTADGTLWYSRGSAVGRIVP